MVEEEQERETDLVLCFLLCVDVYEHEWTSSERGWLIQTLMDCLLKKYVLASAANANSLYYAMPITYSHQPLGQTINSTLHDGHVAVDCAAISATLLRWIDEVSPCSTHSSKYKDEQRNVSGSILDRLWRHFPFVSMTIAGNASNIRRFSDLGLKFCLPLVSYLERIR